MTTWTPEPDETFTVTLTNPTGATLGDATATGTIRNDDGTAETGVAVVSGRRRRCHLRSSATPIRVAVTFGEAVTVDTTGGTPSAQAIDIGPGDDVHGREAGPRTRSGTRAPTR